MSKRIKKHAFLLGALCSAKPKLIRQLLEDKEIMTCLCECAANVLKGNVPLNNGQFLKLKRYREPIRQLASKRNSHKKKKKTVVQKGSGFLSALLGPIATHVLAPIAGELFKL